MVDEETIEKLSLRHIGRFAGRIRAGNQGHANIRVDECRMYMKIWKSIKRKGTWEKLDKEERMELLDAVHDDEIKYPLRVMRTNILVGEDDD